jgi:hypothetical protein
VIVLKKSEFSPARRFAGVLAIAFEGRRPSGGRDCCSKRAELCHFPQVLRGRSQVELVTGAQRATQHKKAQLRSLGRGFMSSVSSGASQATIFCMYASAFVHLLAFAGALRRPAAMLAA